MTTAQIKARDTREIVAGCVRPARAREPQATASLLTSAGTLVCCTLPALIVAVGAGAARVRGDRVPRARMAVRVQGSGLRRCRCHAVAGRRDAVALARASVSGRSCAGQGVHADASNRARRLPHLGRRVRRGCAIRVRTSLGDRLAAMSGARCRHPLVPDIAGVPAARTFARR